MLVPTAYARLINQHSDHPGMAANFILGSRQTVLGKLPFTAKEALAEHLAADCRLLRTPPFEPTG